MKLPALKITVRPKKIDSKPGIWYCRQSYLQQVNFWILKSLQFILIDKTIAHEVNANFLAGLRSDGHFGTYVENVVKICADDLLELNLRSQLIINVF